MEMACGKLELHLSGTCKVLREHTETCRWPAGQSCADRLRGFTGDGNQPGRTPGSLDKGSPREGFASTLGGLRWAQPGFGAGPPSLPPWPLPPAPLSREVPVFQRNELAGQKRSTQQLSALR